MRILVIEDHPDLQIELIDYLAMQGYHAEGAGCLASMNQKLSHNHYQAVLLDIGLPDGDGIDIIPELRQRFGLTLGIIIVSARGQPQERTEALAKGADAYLVKPVYLPELMALLQQLQQRLPATGWQLDAEKYFLHSPADHKIPLTPGEYALLISLLEHNNCLSKSALQQMLTPYLDQVNYSRLDTLICRLRQKVEQLTGLPLPLQTLRNKGYQLTDISFKSI